MQKLNIPYFIISSLEQLQILRNRTKGNLRNIKVKAIELRETFLLKRLTAHEIQDDKKG